MKWDVENVTRKTFFQGTNPLFPLRKRYTQDIILLLKWTRKCHSDHGLKNNAISIRRSLGEHKTHNKNIKEPQFVLWQFFNWKPLTAFENALLHVFLLYYVQNQFLFSFTNLSYVISCNFWMLYRIHIAPCMKSYRDRSHNKDYYIITKCSRILESLISAFWIGEKLRQQKIA